MQKVRAGQAPGKLAIDVGGLGIHDIGNAHHGGGGDCAFVHRAENHAVVVRIEETGGDVFAFGVDDSASGGKVLADGFDAPAGDQNVSVLEDALRSAGPDGGALYQHGIGSRQWAATVERSARKAFAADEARFGIGL